MARILLAEDDDSLRTFLARSLLRAGHEVEPVADGLAAMSALEGRRFDVLVADIVMPGLDGIALARRAESRDPGIRVLLITGFAAVALEATRAGLGRARVLSKPIHLRALVAQVESMLVDA